MIPKALATFIVCLVTLVWVANFVAQFLIPSYHVDGWVHGIFLSVVGSALAFSRKDNAPGKEGASPNPVVEVLGRLTNPNWLPPPPPAPSEPPAGPSPPAPPPAPPDPEPPRTGGAHRAPLTFLLPRAAMS